MSDKSRKLTNEEMQSINGGTGGTNSNIVAEGGRVITGANGVTAEGAQVSFVNGEIEISATYDTIGANGKKTTNTLQVDVGSNSSSTTITETDTSS